MNYSAMAAKAPVSAGEKSEQEAAEDARLDEVSEATGFVLGCGSALELNEGWRQTRVTLNDVVCAFFVFTHTTQGET